MDKTRLFGIEINENFLEIIRNRLNEPSNNHLIGRSPRTYKGQFIFAYGRNQRKSCFNLLEANLIWYGLSSC